MPDPEELAWALEESFQGVLVRGDEQCGPRTVIRLIKQFQVEFRLGEQAERVTVMDRVCCSPDDRRENAERFELLLESQFQLWRNGLRPEG